MDRAVSDAKVLRALREGRPGKRGWVKANCPFCVTRVHKEDKSRALSVLAGVGVYRCHRCKTKGKLGQVPSFLRDFTPAPFELEVLDPPEAFCAFAGPEGTSKASLPYWTYLASRGVSPTLASQLGMGFCPSGRYAGRVVAPVLGDDGAWLGWVGRSIWKRAKRPYIYPDDWIRGILLYNEAALGVATPEPCLLVEGVFDALYYWPHAVALLGTPHTEEQFAALLSTCRPLVSMLDGDAWELGDAVRMRLRFNGKRAGCLRLPPKKDPDELGVDPDIVREWATYALDMPGALALELEERRA